MNASSGFRVCSLFSGSRGNCTYVRAGDTRILIDAGMSCRAISKALTDIGDSLDTINAIFITHEHSDHTKALPVLLKKHPVPVHMTSPTFDELKRSGMPTDCFFSHPPVFSLCIAANADTCPVRISSFPVPHDSRMCVGYRITAELPDGIHTAAVATDMGCVTDDIRNGLYGVENIVLEANHDVNMLLMGPYSYDLKRRILSDHGHLSNEACGAFSCDLVRHGTKRIILAHLSPENNTPELAYLTVLAALRKEGFEPDRDFILRVSDHKTPVILTEEAPSAQEIPEERTSRTAVPALEGSSL